MPDTLGQEWNRRYPHPHDPIPGCRICSLFAHIDALTEVANEPHHLGFPVSGKTGTYDGTVVMVKRDWYERILAILRGEQ